MGSSKSGTCRSAWWAGLTLAALVATTSAASAAVRREGEWPASDRKVTLELSGVPRREAVKKLADAAGWSVVIPGGIEEPVDVVVKDQPADKVLDLLLADGSYLARRDGTLVYIARDAVTVGQAPPAIALLPSPQAIPAPPAVPAPPAPPDPAASVDPSGHRGSHGHHGKSGASKDDRFVTAGNLRVEKDETVGDVTVMGGSADVLGHVTGDVVVIGGSARIHETAHVDGDATAVGGSITVDDGAHVDGDLAAIGGVTKKGPNAVIGGSSASVHGPGSSDTDDDDDKKSSKSLIDDVREHGPRAMLVEAGREIGSSLTAAALLFAFGAVLVALLAQRMDRLKLEAAARPMRSFALGVVGSIAGLVVFIALCVTLVGIPVALFALAGAVIAAYAGLCAALQALGEVLLRHKTLNPYVHLAAGCALFLVLSVVPFFGAFVKFVAGMIGFGAFVATRGAGLLPSRPAGSSQPPGGDPPYRTAAEV